MSGYDQFFKQAKKAAGQPKPRPLTSDELAQKLRARMQTEHLQQKRSPIKLKKRISIPWKLVGFSMVGLLLAALGFQNIDRIEKEVQRVEISFFGKAFAEEATPEPKTSEKSPGDTNKKEAVGGEKSKEENPLAKKEYSEEELNHLGKLNERKRDLDAREEELNKLEQEILQQREIVEKKMAELEQTRKAISSTLEEKVQADDKKIENLVQVYSTMKPPQAAKALEEMDETLAIEIIGRMKKKNAAEIMNLVKPEKVKVFSEKYAGYKQK